MNKLSKEKRDKLILIGLATTMTIGFWWTFVIGAQADKLGDYTKKIAGLRTKVSGAELLSRLGPVIDQNLQKSRKILDSKQSLMAPAAGQRYWLLKLVDQFKKSYAMDLLDISQPSEEELGVLPKFPYKAVIFGVKASAQYHEFGRFLADFENAFPYMAIRNIKLEREGAKGGITSAPGSGTPGAVSSNRDLTPSAGGENLNIEFKIVALIKPITS